MEYINYSDIKFNSIDEFMEFDYSHDDLLEYINGDIYLFASPSTNHEAITINIVLGLGNYLKKTDTKCRVYSAPTDLKLGNNKFIPDIMVVCEKSKGNYFETIPPLIVEIVSPGNMSHDTVFKRRLYEKYGVQEYWIVYPIGKYVEVCFLTLKKYVSEFYYDDEIIESKVLEGFKISLEDLFEDLNG